MSETIETVEKMPLHVARAVIERRLDPTDAINSQANLLETLILVLGVRNHARLARKLQVAPPMVSKWRHDRLAITPDGYITMHEETDILIADLRRMAGDDRPHTGPSAGPDPRVVAGIFKRRH